MLNKLRGSSIENYGHGLYKAINLVHEHFHNKSSFDYFNREMNEYNEIEKFCRQQNYLPSLTKMTN